MDYSQEMPCSFNIIWFFLWAQRARVRGTVYNVRGKWDFQHILNSYFSILVAILTRNFASYWHSTCFVTSCSYKSWAEVPSCLLTFAKFPFYYITLFRLLWVITSLSSFLVTTFLSKRTLPRDLKRSSFAESFMHGTQYLFNKGFSFSESHLTFFLPSSNGEQQW